MMNEHNKQHIKRAVKQIQEARKKQKIEEEKNKKTLWERFWKKEREKPPEYTTDNAMRKYFHVQAVRDTSMLGSFFFFWFTFIAPIFYMWSRTIDDPQQTPISFVLFLSSVIMVISSIVSILSLREDLGCLSAPIRIWVLAFGVLTIINTYGFL